MARRAPGPTLGRGKYLADPGGVDLASARWNRTNLGAIGGFWGSGEVFRNLVLFGDGGMIFKKIGASFGGELSFDFQDRLVML